MTEHRTMLATIAEAAGFGNPAPAPVAPNRELPEATDYIASLEKTGHKLSSAEREAIATYAEKWCASGDIRAEFLTFAAFAAYQRMVAQGRVRIVGRTKL